MAPSSKRHCTHHFATQSSLFVDGDGWQTKMASIEFWIPWSNVHDDICTSTVRAKLFLYWYSIQRSETRHLCSFSSHHVDVKKPVLPWVFVGRVDRRGIMIMHLCVVNMAAWSERTHVHTGKKLEKRYFVCKGLSHKFAISVCKHNAFQMRGGWVAIVSARKSQIALFEFACTMLWLTRQRLLSHRIWPVHDITTRGRFRKCVT